MSNTKTLTKAAPKPGRRAFLWTMLYAVGAAIVPVLGKGPEPAKAKPVYDVVFGDPGARWGAVLNGTPSFGVADVSVSGAISVFDGERWVPWQEWQANGRR